MAEAGHAGAVVGLGGEAVDGIDVDGRQLRQGVVDLEDVEGALVGRPVGPAQRAHRLGQLQILLGSHHGIGEERPQPLAQPRHPFLVGGWRPGGGVRRAAGAWQAG